MTYPGNSLWDTITTEALVTPVISAENRFQNKDGLIREFNEQSSINNRLLSLCVPTRSLKHESQR